MMWWIFLIIVVFIIGLILGPVFSRWFFGEDGGP